jgi:hypothetical protein
VPRKPPLAAPPRAAAAAPPLLEAPAKRDAGAGVVNLGVALEDVGGLSTKDVSVVLIEYAVNTSMCRRRNAYMNVVSPSKSPV